MRISTTLERVAIGVASLALSFGLIAVLSGFFAGRDQAGVSGNPATIGQAYRDLGHTHLNPGELHPVYDSTPPTSGAHVVVPITHDRPEITDDQLLTALENGNVVIMYATRRPPPALTALANQLAGPFSPALAAAGGAVILVRRASTVGLLGLAWAHVVSVGSAADPRLRAFADYWLGRGAP